ncbi:MAG: ribosomal-protein-alanine N-acetyltransferase [Lachnospiraceae bacterium]|nr:ribosomal-protein-alanine N-acetyltransferase [Lachnospiraceae bacterium]
MQNHMEFKIRKMTAADIPAAALLEQKYFSVPWSEKSLRDSLNNPHAHFVSAHIADKMIGYGGMYIVCGEGEITDIVVDEEYRNLGVGTAMMRTLEREAKAAGAEYILLEVRVSNQAAIRCYEKTGYECIGIRKAFYEKPVEDAVIMRLEIEREQEC